MHPFSLSLIPLSVHPYSFSSSGNPLNFPRIKLKLSLSGVHELRGVGVYRAKLVRVRVRASIRSHNVTCTRSVSVLFVYGVFCVRVCA